MKKAVYAGSFDPMHKGHISIIDKALTIFDELVVLVANNPSKEQTPLEERFETLKEQLKDKKVVVKPLWIGTVVDEMDKLGITNLVRSARDAKDFEFEILMNSQNKTMNPKINTILILPDPENYELRSSLLPSKIEMVLSKYVTDNNLEVRNNSIYYKGKRVFKFKIDKSIFVEYVDGSGASIFAKTVEDLEKFMRPMLDLQDGNACAVRF